MEPYIFDLERTLFGNLSPDLVFDVILRTVVLYGYALFLLRLVGSRGLGTMSFFEILLTIVISSAVGSPILFLDVSVIHAMIAMTVIAGMQWAMIALVTRNSRLEDVLEGRTIRIVERGMFDRDGMRRARMSREEVAFKLRLNDVAHLGQVKGAYLESNGEVSVFLYPNADQKPGLDIVPPWDVNPPIILPNGTPAPERAHFACLYCGYTVHHEKGQRFETCPRCQKQEGWLYSSEVTDWQG